MRVDQWSRDLVAELQRAVEGGGKTPVDPPGGGPQDEGMSDLPYRVGRLEEDVKEVRADVRAVRDDLGDIKQTLARIEGRFGVIEGRFGALEGRLTGIEGRFAHIPTTFQMVSLVVAVLVAVGAFRFLEPRLVTAPPAVTAPAR